MIFPSGGLLILGRQTKAGGKIHEGLVVAIGSELNGGGGARLMGKN